MKNYGVRVRVRTRKGVGLNTPNYNCVTIVIY